MKINQIILLCASCILLSACDVARGLYDNFKSYSEPTTIDTARIRFVSTADDVRVYTNTTCASTRTDAGSVFYHKYPNTFRASRSIDMPLADAVPKPYVEYHVPANQPIVVNFHKRYPMGNGQLVCNLLVTFTPEKGKDYQLQLLSNELHHGFFTPNKNICYLRANEIIESKNGYQLVALSIKPTDFCRKNHLSLF